MFFNSKDAYVIKQLNEVEKEIKSNPSEYRRSFRQVGKLCAAVGYATQAEDRHFRTRNNQNKSWLIAPGYEVYPGTVAFLPIKKKDAKKELSKESLERIDSIVVPLVQQFGKQDEAPWESLEEICLIRPNLVGIIQEHPESFNFYQGANVNKIVKISPETFNKDKIVRDYHFGAVDITQESPILPIVHKRDNDDNYFFYGDLHGNEKWMSHQVNMQTYPQDAYFKERSQNEHFVAFLDNVKGKKTFVKTEKMELVNA